MKKVFRPRSNGFVRLSSPCRSRGHLTGLVIVRFNSDLRFIRSGGCDAAFHAVEVEA